MSILKIETELAEYDAYVSRASEYILTMMEAERDYENAREAMIKAKWAMGEWINENDFTVDVLIRGLDDRGIKHPDRSELYRCCQYHEKASSEQMLAHVKWGWTWKRIIQEFLPKDGSSEKVEKVVSYNEIPTRKLYGMIERNEIPEEDKPGVCGFLGERINDDMNALNALDSEYVPDLVLVEPVQQNVDNFTDSKVLNISLQAHHPDTWKPSEFEAFKRDIATQGCFATGTQEHDYNQIQFHHWPRTVKYARYPGSGVPVSNEIHTKYQGGFPEDMEKTVIENMQILIMAMWHKMYTDRER